MSVGRFLQQAAAGNAGAGVYVDDVFSTYLYEGNGSTQTITNGIDLDGEGGLVWIKNRDQADSHILTDTERGATKNLFSDLYVVEGTDADTLTAFNSDGFAIGDDVKVNTNTEGYASWTFRKQPGFFDVVTWTGTGSGSITVSHNLGSVPGTILVKATNAEQEWFVYHRSLGATKYLHLSTAGAPLTQTQAWNDTEPTSTEFTGGSYLDQNGRTYVAYLFAHDAQDFGTNSNESIIKCGSYTGNGSTTGPEIALGFEPQWILIKETTNANSWAIWDTMRGITDSSGSILLPNLSNAEIVSANYPISLSANGFQPRGTNTLFNGSGRDYIYVAIRRPHKPASEFAATDLFEAFEDRTSIANQINGTMGPVDVTMQTQVPTAFLTYHFAIFDRLRGQKFVSTSSTAAESGASVLFDTNEGVENEGVFTNGGLGYNFKRAPGFFDVVAYTGTGSNMTIPHNLGVAPELFILKKRNLTRSWVVYSKSIDIDQYLTLNTTGAAGSFALWQSTAPTATQFTVGTDGSVNGSGDTFVVYLFATVPGISKVGSYTGTASDVNVNCGFTSGARFVLVKRTDSTGDWYVWDYVRGIVAGNDPYLLFNSTATEVTSTDYIDPLSSGFTITSSAPAALNASGGTYIFLAIA